MMHQIHHVAPRLKMLFKSENGKRTGRGTAENVGKNTSSITLEWKLYFGLWNVHISFLFSF